jgi:hypothetical protein
MCAQIIFSFFKNSLKIARFRKMQGTIKKSWNEGQNEIQKPHLIVVLAPLG